jgi:hypothetical protein
MTEEHFEDNEAGHLHRDISQVFDGIYVREIRRLTCTKMDQMFHEGFTLGHLPYGFGKEYVRPLSDLKPGERLPSVPDGHCRG